MSKTPHRPCWSRNLHWSHSHRGLPEFLCTDNCASTTLLFTLPSRSTLNRSVETAAHEELSGPVIVYIRNHTAVGGNCVNWLLFPKVPNLYGIIVTRSSKLFITCRYAPTWKPFGEKRQHTIPFACPCDLRTIFEITCNVEMLRPVRRSQMRQTPDWSQVAAKLPSHWKSSPITSLACPSCSNSCDPVSTSHRRNEQSRLTVPQYRPLSKRETNLTTRMKLHSSYAIDVSWESLQQHGMILGVTPQLRRFYSENKSLEGLSNDAVANMTWEPWLTISSSRIINVELGLQLMLQTRLSWALHELMRLPLFKFQSRNSPPKHPVKRRSEEIAEFLLFTRQHEIGRSAPNWDASTKRDYKWKICVEVTLYWSQSALISNSCDLNFSTSFSSSVCLERRSWHLTINYLT